jgi:HicA toxin of bacterial toxin-antitoxin,
MVSGVMDCFTSFAMTKKGSRGRRGAREDDKSKPNHLCYQITLANTFMIAKMTNMNGRHTKTLAAVFAEPTSVSLEWARIESLLVGVGCVVIEGSGSRERFVHGTTVATFHRPHPAKEAKAYQVDEARSFLTLIGITP